MARPGLPIRRRPLPGAGVLRLLPLGVVLIGLPGCSEAQPGAETAASPETQVVWRAGASGYHTYRIPVALATPGGALLAFAEGRRTGRGDAGDIDLLVKRSNDGGRTWADALVVCDDGPHTCGNPAPVVDRRTGVIHLLMTRNLGTDRERAIMAGTSEDVRRVYHAQSTDDGRSWTVPRDISATTRAPDWRWYATGPVHGIQLTRGPHAGRLVVPANHSVPGPEAEGPERYRSHVLVSDDRGRTWRSGGIHEPYTNESTVVELSDGSLLQNMRSYHGRNRRAVATSRDGGQTWSAVRLDATLIEPVCQASLLRYGWPDMQHPRGILLFSNPAGTTRARMTVRASFDDGATWPVEKLIEEGSAAYSSLVRLSDGRVGLLYERADYREIVFSAFTLDWLLEG